MKQKSYDNFCNSILQPMLFVMVISIFIHPILAVLIFLCMIAFSTVMSTIEPLFVKKEDKYEKIRNAKVKPKRIPA